MEINFQNFGWKSKVAQKRFSFSISINKMIAVECCLEKGETLYCYLAEDENKRPIIIVYLDGEKKGCRLEFYENRKF